MEKSANRHKNYEILNLIGYGLSKFNDDFINEFGFKTKTAFYNYCVDLGIAETVGTVKNRMDLFDHFFPENSRRGWWQKGNAYIHRKIFIDSLFGNENAKGFANIVKLYLKDTMRLKDLSIKVNNVAPIVKSRFKQLQETGLKAEMYFLENYNSIELFENGVIEDARSYGDGYDFQVDVNQSCFLAEIKGIRKRKGDLRLTQNEYKKAKEYKDDYILTVVLNLDDIPFFKTIENPTKNLEFKVEKKFPKPYIEYHSVNPIQ